MITDGRLERLEDVARRLERHERMEPMWNARSAVMSAASSGSLFGSGLLITNYATNTMTQGMVAAIMGLTILCAAIAIITFFYCHAYARQRKEEYEFESQIVWHVIKKTRESIIRDHP